MISVADDQAYGEILSVTKVSRFWYSWCPLCLHKDVFRYGRSTSGRFFYVGSKQEYGKMVLISFEHLEKILIFPKFQLRSSKIVPATPFWILKFKRAWQAQFLSHNLVTLKNCVFFIGVQMILIPFFDISNQKSVISKKLIFLFNVIPK